MLQSSWNREGDVWGRVGGIVKAKCGAELVELRRWCVGQSWWKCEGDLWDIVGGIVKVKCGADLVEL